MITTRFAPSPTGNLHIGGARTCLFSWLFARANQGKFILRIEDTDKERSKKEFVDEILGSIKWLGFDWDALFYQSERFALYKKFAEKLLSEGKAYHPDDGTPAIILKMPQKIISFVDAIHGTIEFDATTIKDQVLMKSDGTPTYNFACVVDDADLNITHVIRGDDHISNTPKQIIMYEALGFGVPTFAHIPMIMAQEGGRMSKRFGATALSEYKNQGFLADALVNYLSLLGWSAGENQEIISTKEMIQKFSIKDVNKTAAAFNMDKLKWINNYYIKQRSLDELLELTLPLYQAKGWIQGDNFDRKHLCDLLQLYRERANTLVEIVERSAFFFDSAFSLSPEAENKLREKDVSRELATLRKRFSGLKHFDHASVEEAFRQTIEEAKLASKVFIHPLRAAVTGMLVGPGIFEVIALLGKDTVDKRLAQALERMSTT